MFKYFWSGLFLCCAIGGAIGRPGETEGNSPESMATGRALDQMIHPLTLNTGMTKGAIDSTLSVLGFTAVSLAFIVIPLLTLLYTSSAGFAKNPIARGIKEYYMAQDISSNIPHTRHARGILDNDKCIERFVCELQTGARSVGAERWTRAIFTQVPNEGKFLRRVSKTYRQDVPDCGTYKCETVGFIVRLFIYSTDWNTILKG